MKLKKIVWLLAAFYLITNVTFAAEDRKEDDGDQAMALIAATLNNNSAMQPVEWKVMRLDNNSVVKKTKAHSFALSLRPGSYKAIAKLNGITRDRTFSVLDNNRVNVVIAMDQ